MPEACRLPSWYYLNKITARETPSDPKYPHPFCTVHHRHEFCTLAGLSRALQHSSVAALLTDTAANMRSLGPRTLHSAPIHGHMLRHFAISSREARISVGGRGVRAFLFPLHVVLTTTPPGTAIDANDTLGFDPDKCAPLVQ